VSGVLQDISALKAASIELEAARTAAEAGSRAKSEFLPTMSHEIRTPLNGVLGAADLLQTTTLDEEQKDFVAILKNSGRTLMATINEILDFSKIEAGRLTLESTAFAPVALAEEVCALLRPQAVEKGLLLQLDCASDLPACLQGDPYRIRQVLLNLLSNAVKFTHAGLIDVELGWRTAGPGMVLLRLSVRDTGIGVAPEVQDRLFSPFTQVEASITRRYGGTGLGLTIAKSLVEAMGGRIGLVSAKGDGACFWVELVLPVCPAVQLPTQQDHAARDAAVGVALQFRGRVLLAEDNPVNQQVAEQILLRQGVEVVCAENGRIAVERFAAEHFDLVLMDMQMPEMDGLEATRAIRALQAGSEASPIPIVALTANVQGEDRAHCLAAGMNDFITKPVRVRDVALVLLRWLGQGAVVGPLPEKLDTALETTADTNSRTALPVLDTRVFTELTEATGMQSGELIGMLFADLERMAGELQAANLQQDCAAMHHVAHTVKSLSAQLGAKKLSAIAHAIEHAARNAQLAACAENLPVFMAGVAELRAAIQAQSANPSSMA
jgi:CheY-like chemotaxis protein